MSCQRVWENGFVWSSLKPHSLPAQSALNTPLPVAPLLTPQNCAFSAEDALTSSFFWLLLTRKPTLKVWTPTTLEKSSFRTASCSLLCHGAMFQMLSELAPAPRPPQKTG